ncbi:uncharacterized protein [Palaemon carinicauda]|uniref:uncharacterized protein n=1 Tax=Palaemon carinicauda TaxID=392227 RepID=UPI0035B650E7
MVNWKIVILTFSVLVKHGVSAGLPHTTDGREDANDISTEAATQNSVEESFEEGSGLGEGEGLFPLDSTSGDNLLVSDEESVYNTDYVEDSEDYEEQDFSNEADNYNSTEMSVSNNTFAMVNGTDGGDALTDVYLEQFNIESKESVGNNCLSDEKFNFTEDGEIERAEEFSRYIEAYGDDFDSNSGDDEIRAPTKMRDKKISKRRDFLYDNFTMDESNETSNFNASYGISIQGNASQTGDENELTKNIKAPKIILKKSEFEEMSMPSERPIAGATGKSLKTDRIEIETPMSPNLEILADSGEDIKHRKSREIDDYEDVMGNLSLPTSANQERPSTADYPKNSGDDCNKKKESEDGVPVKVMHEHISKKSKHIILDLTTSGKNNAEKWSSMLNGTNCKTPLSESDSLSSVTVLMDSSTGSQSVINNKSPDGTSIIIIDLIDSSENNSSEIEVDETEDFNKDHAKLDPESTPSLVTPDYSQNLTKEQENSDSLVSQAVESYENGSNSHLQTENCFIFAERDLRQIIPRTVFETIASTPNRVDLIITENSVEPLNNSQPDSPGDFSIFYNKKGYYTICTLLEERELLLAFTEIKRNGSANEKSKDVFHFHVPENQNCLIFSAKDIKKIIPETILERATTSPNGLNLVFTENSVAPSTYLQPNSRSDFSISLHSSDHYTICTLLSERELLMAFTSIEGKHIPDENVSDIHSADDTETKNCFIFMASNMNKIIPKSILEKVASSQTGLDLVFNGNSVEQLNSSQPFSLGNFSISVYSPEYYNICTFLTERELLLSLTSITGDDNVDEQANAISTTSPPETRKCFIFAVRYLIEILPTTILDEVASTPDGVDLVFSESSVEPLANSQEDSQADFSLYFTSPHSYTVCTLLTEKQLLMAFTSIKDKQNVEADVDESNDTSVKEVKNCFIFTIRDIQKIIPEAMLRNIKSAPDEMDFVFTDNSVEPLSNLHTSRGDFSVAIHSAHYYKVCTFLNEGKLLMAFSSRKRKQNKYGNYVPSDSKSTPSKAENCFIFGGKDVRQIVPLSILEKVDSSSSRVNLVFSQNLVEPQSYLVPFSQGDFSLSSYEGDYYSICTILNKEDLLKAFGSIKGKTHGGCSEYHTPQLVEIMDPRRVNGNLSSSLLQGKDNETLPNAKSKIKDGTEDDEKRFPELSNSSQKDDDLDDRVDRKCNITSDNDDSFDRSKNPKPTLDEEFTRLGQPGQPICSGNKDPEKTEVGCHNDANQVGKVYVFPILIMPLKPYEDPLIFGRESEYDDSYEKSRLVMHSGNGNAISNQFGNGFTLSPISGFAYPSVRYDWLSEPSNNKRFENGPILSSLNAQSRGERAISVWNNYINNPNDLGNDLSSVWGRNSGNLFKGTGKGHAQTGMKQNGVQTGSWDIADSSRMGLIHRPYPEVYPYIFKNRLHYPRQDVENLPDIQFVPGWKDSQKMEKFRSKSKCRKYPCKESEQEGRKNSFVQLGKIVSGMSHKETSDNGYRNNNLQFINKYNGEYNLDVISDKTMSTENYTYGIDDQYAHDSHEGFENQVRVMSRAEANVQPSPINENVVNADNYLQQSPVISGDNEVLQIATEEGETYNEELSSNRQLSLMDISENLGNRPIMPDRPVNVYASRTPQTYKSNTPENQAIQRRLKSREINTKREISSSDGQTYAVYSNDEETSKIGLGNINGQTTEFDQSYKPIPGKGNVGLKNFDYGWYDSYDPLYSEESSIGVETSQPSSSDFIYLKTEPETSAVYREGGLPYPYIIE